MFGLNIFGSASPPTAAPDKASAETPVTNARVVDLKTLIFFGLAINFGGFANWWNFFFELGFKEMLIGACYMGVLFILLALTFAEMSSAVPFAGGSFGYVRCTLGPFWGYLVGASELLENFVFVCALVRSMGLDATIAWEVNDNFDARPSTFPVFYAALFLVHAIGGTFFWRSMMFFGLYAIGIVMMYLIISFRDHDLQHYAYYKLDGYEGEPELFLRRLHYVMVAYMGLQIIPLTSERIIDVRKNLPIALVTCTVVTFVTEILMICAAAGVFPGVSSKLFKSRCPMCLAMAENMNLDVKWGNLISMFMLWTLAMGYFYSCGHQMHAMANSGLLPKVLRSTWGPNKQPVLCFLISAVMQCAACVWLYYKFPLLLIVKIVCIGASFVYLAMFAAYIVFRTRFKNMQREFRSPFGIAGAVVGICMGLGLWIGTMFFQEDFNAMSIYLVYIGGNIVFYFAYVQHNQFFSEEEQNKFMKAYVMNANKMTKRRGGKKATMLDKMFLYAVTLFPFLAPGSSSRRSANTNGASSANNATKQGGSMLSKINSVAPGEKEKALPSVRHTVDGSSTPADASMETPVVLPVVVPHIPNVPMIAESSRQNSMASLPSQTGAQRRLSLRWTGQLLNETESKKMFQAMLSGKENIVEEVAVVAPEKFETVEEDPSRQFPVGDELDPVGDEIRQVEMV